MAKRRPYTTNPTTGAQEWLPSADALDAKINVSGPDVFLGRKTAGEGGHEELTISGLPAETTPASGDLLLIEVAGVLSKLDIANLPGGGASYALYTALLSQSGTDDPTAVVLENTLGGTVVWTRDAGGEYRGTLTGAFTTDKTVGFGGAFLDGDGYANTAVVKTNASEDFVKVFTQPLQTNLDGALNGTSIEIRVYP